MSPAALASLLLLVLCSVLHSEARTFRIAFALFGELSDFAWTFHCNYARRVVVSALMEMYPNVTITHEYAFLPQSFSEECHPQFEAWCKAGVDLLVSTDVGRQWCTANLAALYPNVSIINVASSVDGPPNYATVWVRLYQSLYIAGHTAGRMTKAKKVCISAIQPIPAGILDASSFFRGVHHADPTVEIHVFSTGALVYPLLEMWIVNQSHALGCDVMWIQTTDGNSAKWSTELGLMTIGYVSDAIMVMGDNILTSAMINMIPGFMRAAEAVLNGTFPIETRKPDWWMGWSWGATNIAQFSLLVPKDIQAQVLAQVATVDRMYCGRVCTKTHCLCNSSSCCLSDAELYTMDTFPDFVNYHGIVQLPGLACEAGQFATYHLDTFTMVCNYCPAGTYAYNVDQFSECRPCPIATYSLPASSACTKCPAGSYSDRLGASSCTLCPVGSIAANPGSSNCNVCPSGMTNAAGTQCGQASLLWLAGVGAGVGVIFLLVGIWAWWASRKMRQMNKQFSNNNVAIECAAAIARLDLQAVAWLRDIHKPNCIQQSFIRIVHILEQVRKFVPDQLLQSMAQGKEEDAGEEDIEEEASLCETPRDRRSTMSSSILHVSSRSSSAVRRSSRLQRPSVPRHHSRSSSKGCEGQSLFVMKKVTYMLVQFNVNQHYSSAPLAECNMKSFLSYLIETVKSNDGTIGHVLYDDVIIHWGTGKRAISEAPMKAVQTAMALVAFGSKLHGNTQLILNIAIGLGNTISGVLETTANHFFMVGGGQVPLVQRTARKDWKAVLGAPILITDAVKASVQYSFVCHPRLVDGKDILWEPIRCIDENAEDEWMYQLKEMEHTTPSTSALLVGPFTALRQLDYGKAESLAREVRQQCTDLHPNDLAALDWLASAVQSRTSGPAR